MQYRVTNVAYMQAWCEISTSLRKRYCFSHKLVKIIEEHLVEAR